MRVRMLPAPPLRTNTPAAARSGPIKPGPLMHKAVAVIPCYNHPQTIGTMVAAVRAHGLEVVVVDDGSDAACAKVLDELAALHGAGVVLLRLEHNQGKGGAMMMGL